jgi:hypothetical protein
LTPLTNMINLMNERNIKVDSDPFRTEYLYNEAVRLDAPTLANL